MNHNHLRGYPHAEYDLSHLGMALGMAAMFSPVGDPAPKLLWVVLFGMAAAWFVSRALSAGVRADTAWRHDSIGHHLVANLAMLFMLISPDHQHGGLVSVAGSGGSGHAGHGGAAGGGWLEGPLGTVLAVLLGGYFAVQAIRSLLRLRAARPAGPASPPAGPASPPGGMPAGAGAVAVVTAPGSRTAPWVRTGCHGVMDVAMTVMFAMMLWP